MVESELVALNLATVDALTGVANLRGFTEIGRYILALGRRPGHPVELPLVRLEPQEDAARRRALVELSQVLLASFRESDLIARVGEYEFAVLRSRDTVESGGPEVERLETILESINADRPREKRLRAEAVVVPFVPARHVTPMALIAEAGKRLKSAVASTADALK